MTKSPAIIDLAQWLRTPAGRYMLAWEQEHLDRAVVDCLGWQTLDVDLTAQTVTAQGKAHAFTIEEEPRQMLLEGLDAIALTLKSLPEIDAWTKADRAQRPWIYAGKAA